MAAEGPVPTSPVCDVAVETALCLHNAEKILMPDARPYGEEAYNAFSKHFGKNVSQEWRFI